MRLVIARCTVEYSGRLSARLPEAVRLIMVKADGCVAIHSDGGAYKPLNWMNAPNTLVCEPDAWRVTNRAGERIDIALAQVLSDVTVPLGHDPGLVKDGVEAHLQELVAEHPETVWPGAVLVRREHPTAVGPVDLLVRGPDGAAVAVEIKRRGEIDGVEQLSRYLEFLNRDGEPEQVRGVFAAQEIRPQARALAAARGIVCVVLDYDEMRGMASSTPRLF